MPLPPQSLASPVVWTRLRPAEKQALDRAARHLHRARSAVLGLAVRRWLQAVYPQVLDDHELVTVSRTDGDEERTARLWARLHEGDKLALLAVVRASGQPLSTLIRQAFLWWFEQGAQC